jgi:hypothetical protein
MDLFIYNIYIYLYLWFYIQIESNDKIALNLKNVNFI